MNKRLGYENKNDEKVEKKSILHGSCVNAKNVFCVAQLKKVDRFFFIGMLAVNWEDCLASKFRPAHW